MSDAASAPFVCRNADEFIRQQSYWLRFGERDLNAAANDVILAMDGKIARSDALLCARAVFESFGMEKRVEASPK